MKAIIVTDREAGVAGMVLAGQPEPYASENDVTVRVHASGFTPGELAWPSTWSDRAGRDRTPSIPVTSAPVSSPSSATAPPA